MPEMIWVDEKTIYKVGHELVKATLAVESGDARNAEDLAYLNGVVDAVSAMLKAFSPGEQGV